MRRLIEADDSPDLDEAFASRALSAKSPHEVDAFMRDRVYAALRRKRKKAAAPVGMRVMIAAGLAIVLMASASFAAKGQLVQRIRRAMVVMLTGRKAAPVAISTALAAQAPAPQTIAPSIIELPLIEPPVVSLPAPMPRHRKKEPAAPIAQDEAPSVEDGARIATQAFDALRNHHDASRALGYIEAYETGYPSGALAEEMAALRVEAFASSGDDRQLEAARDYLRRYPRGRFVAQAKRALVP
jgi:hypothetical protein